MFCGEKQLLANSQSLDRNRAEALGGEREKDRNTKVTSRRDGCTFSWLLTINAGGIPMPWPFVRKSSAVLASDVTGSTGSPSTRFAFRLFHELVSGDSTNVFFSPSSVMLCLAMVHEVASGKTRQAMAQALEITGLDPINTNLTIVGLRALFRGREHLEVMGANSLWCSDHVQVRPECAAKLRDIYDAELTTLDFAAPDAVPRINAWVNERTKGKISHVLNELSPLAAMVAVNAIYFKGRWAIPFERELTRIGPFTTSTGQRKHLPMMCQLGMYSYYEDDESQAVALCYEGDMAMYVILPAASTNARRFQQSLSSGAWESRLARFENVEGTIRIPRFKLDYRAQLERALKVLGMERAFDRNQAEFDGVRAGQLPVWIDQLFHRAVVELNEEGTEAAAATMVTMCFSSSIKPRHFEMIIDRPFFVAIRDNTTGTILFMGWVGDPGCVPLS
jgi:serine protease inhibitor